MVVHSAQELGFINFIPVPWLKEMRMAHFWKVVEFDNVSEIAAEVKDILSS